MSKREVLMRYNAIIKLLKKKPATLKEIEADLALQSELHEYDLKISKRTFSVIFKIFFLYTKLILNMIFLKKLMPLYNKKTKT